MLLKFPLLTPVPGSHPEYITTKNSLACEQALWVALLARWEKEGELAKFYVSQILISASKKSMRNANDISNDVITLGTYEFFTVCLHLRSFLLHADWRKSDSSVNRGVRGELEVEFNPFPVLPPEHPKTENSLIPLNLLWTLRIEYWGLFLERLSNFSDPKSSTVWGWGGGASLSDNFMVSFSKLLKPLS